MNSRYIAPFSGALMLVLNVTAMAGTPANSQISAGALIAQADALYPQRESQPTMTQALALYEQAISMEKTNHEALWKASRAAWWAATRSHDKAERLKIFKTGIQWGEAAIAQSPSSAEAHFWLGGNYGSYGHSRGVLSSLFLVPKVRREMEASLRFNPSYLGGGAYRLLGLLDDKVPAVAGGSKTRAGDYFEKARAIEPSNPITRYYYAEYLNDIGKKDDALQMLQSIDTLKVSEDEMPELRMIQKERQSLAKKLQS